jgi:hypothetical protein
MDEQRPSKLNGLVEGLVALVVLVAVLGTIVLYGAFSSLGP